MPSNKDKNKVTYIVDSIIDRTKILCNEFNQLSLKILITLFDSWENSGERWCWFSRIASVVENKFNCLNSESWIGRDPEETEPTFWSSGNSCC